MTAYLLRRLLLVIPTLFGIIAINFAVIQFAPGGPVEQMIAELRGKGDLSVAARRGHVGVRRPGAYRGARGLDPHIVADIRKMFGFDKPPLTRFARHGRRLSAFRLRPQLLSRQERAATHPAEDAGLDLARSVVHAADLHRLHPARHRQGGARRQPLRSSRPAPSCWSATPCRASCSPSCWSCCSPAAASSTGSR